MLLLLKSPTVFFKTLKLETLGNKTLFVGTACLAFGIFSESAIQMGLTSIMRGAKPIADLIPPEQLELIRKEAFLNLAFSPVIAFFGIYLFASALHVMIKALKYSDSTLFKYENTLHLCALCQLPMLFSIVPVFGPIISSVWVFVLLSRALKTFYGLSNLAAFTSILPPALFLKLSWNSALQLLALSV